MKKLLIVIMLTLNTANAGWYDSDYFEPVLVGGVAGVYGFTQADSGDELLMGTLYFAGGYFVTLMINDYARTKVDNHMDRKIKVFDTEIRNIDIKYAEKAYNKESGVYYTNEVESIEDGQQTGSGGYVSPTKVIILEGN
jgi:hypothetical protein